MYLSRLHIDRFGILHDQDVSGLSPGLTVFLGHNEAGKSTCLRFLQAMLFGYKRGNRNLDPIPGRNGKGAGGGSLFLQTAQSGPLVLTRRPGPRGGELSLIRTPEQGGDAGGAQEALAGTALDERDLQRLLTGLTMDVFDAIFAFDLKQIMELSSLKGDNVRHALYGAAFGTGLQSPVQVLQALDDRMSTLLKKRDVASASARISNAVRDLAGVRDALRARGPDLAQYERLHEALEALEDKLARLAEQREADVSALRRVERRLAVWQQWEGVRRIRTELTALGYGESGAPVFAPDARQRLETLLVQEEERLIALRGYQEQRARLERECRDLNPHPLLTAMHAPVQSLREQKDQRRGEALTMRDLEREAETLRAAQRQALALLGPEWDEETVLRFDVSVPGLDAVRRLGEQMEWDRQRQIETTGRAARCDSEYREAVTLFQGTEATLCRLEARYQSPDVPEDAPQAAGGGYEPESLLTGGGNVGVFQIPLPEEKGSAFPRRIRLLRHMEQLVREHGAAAKEYEEAAGTADGRLALAANDMQRASLWGHVAAKGLPVFLAALLVLAAGLGIAGYAVSLRETVTGIEGGVLSLLGLAVAALHLHSASSARKEEESRLAAARQRIQSLFEHTLELEKGIRALIAAASPWFSPEKSGADAPGGLSLAGRGEAPGGLPKELDIALALRDVEEDSRREQALLSLLEERRQRVCQAEQALWVAMEEKEVAEDDARERQGAWEEWLKGHGLVPTLTLKGLNEILNTVIACKERQVRIKDLRQRSAALAAGLSAFHDAVLTLAREAFEAAAASGSPFPLASGLSPASWGGAGDSARTLAEHDTADALRILDSLTALVDQAARDEALHTEKEAQSAVCRVSLAQAQEALDVTRSALAGLLAGAGVADAESFRAAFARWSRMEVLRADERTLLSGIAALAAEEGAAVPDVLASLEHTTLESLEEARVRLQTELAALAEDARIAAEERGRLKERKSALAVDTAGTGLRTREAALLEDLHRFSRQWSVLALAQRILLDAKARYEKEGREGVLRFAGDIFRRITGGEYSGIIASLEGENFLALHSSGEQRDPERELSQGTKEQLYLALRLAYVKNHGRTAEPLPVIMDEILVNFDEGRAQGAARALAGFARENQVLVFTCHPWCADLMLEAGRREAAEGGPAPAAFQVCRGAITALG